MTFSIWWKKLDKYSRAAFIIILCGTLLRLVLASMSHVTGDPCWVISVSRFMAENMKIPLFEPLGRPDFWAPPLFHLITAFFYKAAGLISEGLAEFSVKLVSPLFGSLSLLYLFLTARKLYNSKIAFFSTIFIAFIPLHAYMSAVAYQDVALGFFALASIYYLLDKKPIISGIFTGMALLTKYTAVFVFPVAFLITLSRLSRKRFLKTFMLFLISAMLVSSVWYIRNYEAFGNPLWPFLAPAEEYHPDMPFSREYFESQAGQASLSNLLRKDFALNIYLSLYGVPGGGNAANLMFLDVPGIKLLLAAWLFGTILFSLPMIAFFFAIRLRSQKAWIIITWLLSFLSFAAINKIMNNVVYLRHSMPVLFAMAIMWGVGLEKILSIKKGQKLFRLASIAVIICCIIGFSAVEFVKAIVVSDTWGHYDDDFTWIKENIPKDAVILVPRGDCYAYNFNRYTEGFFEPPYVTTRQKIAEYNISYVWVNQKIDFYGCAENSDSGIYPQGFIDEIEKYPLIYENKETATRIYKVNEIKS